MSEALLYRGEVAIRFEEYGHRYYVSDPAKGLEESSDIPSATGVLSVINKPALLGWAVNQTAEYVGRMLRPGVAMDEVEIQQLVRDAKRARYGASDKAKDIGSIVHKWIEADCMGVEQDVPVNEQAAASIASWLEFKQRFELEVIETEFIVYSRELGYVGTADLDVRIRGRRALVDLKTSKGIYPEYHAQTAAYVEAREEEAREHLYHGRGVIRVPKDGSAVEVAWRNQDDDLDLDMGAYRAALTLWRWKETAA